MVLIEKMMERVVGTHCYSCYARLRKRERLVMDESGMAGSSP